LEKETLYQKIYNDLIEGINSNKFPTGSRLPSEKELSDQYNVSRITSKKALEMLAEQNIITRKPGKGSYVIKNTSAEGTDIISISEGNAANRFIGVILDSFDASFGCDLLNGIERECRRKNYNMILKCTYGSVEAEMNAIDEVLEAGAVGIIIVCVQNEVFNANILKLALDEFPLVLADRPMAGVPLPCVTTNNYEAAKELTKWLFDNGHTRVCYVSHAFTQTPTVIERFRGFVDCHLEHNCVTNESMWIRDLQSFQTVTDITEYRSMDEQRIETFINENPTVTAFFCVQYNVGLLVFQVLKKLGQEKDKQVVFFDGLDESIDSNPIFTRVQQGEYLMGVLSVQLLTDRLLGKKVMDKHIIPYEIVEGKTY
jgi:GntR family transcriptional regulator, arabinose operon transcriptional repressor